MKKLFIILFIIGLMALTILYFKNVSPLNQKLDDVVKNHTVNAFKQHELKNYSLNKYILLYFGKYGTDESARLNKELLKFYKKHKLGNNFDVLYIGCEDKEKKMMSAMMHYKMPWLGVKWNTLPAKLLKGVYAVKKFPALILVDPNGIIYAESSTVRTKNTPEDVLIKTEKLLVKHKKEQLKAAIARRYESKNSGTKTVNSAKKGASSPEKVSYWHNVFNGNSASEASPKVDISSKFKINGLVASGSQYKAILNGKVVSVGDTLKEGFTVISIDSEGVILGLGKNKYTVTL